MKLSRIVVPVFAFATTLMLAASGAAQSASVTMTADRTSVAVGETFQLEVRAELSGATADDLRNPDLSAFRIIAQQVARPRQFSFGVGMRTQVVQSTVVYRYTLQALYPGRFDLNAAKLVVGGRVFSSNPLTIVVAAGGAAPDLPSSTSPPPTSSPPGLSGADYDSQAFLRTVSDKAEPYVGEQATVTVYLYVRGALRAAPSITKEPSTDGFWTHDLLPAARTIEPAEQLVDGVPFQVYVLRRFAAFPLRAGELSIGPMAVAIQTGSLFDLFRAGPSTLQRQGTPISIRARALPEGGHATAVVGSYTLEAQLGRTTASTGDAVTLTATARGIGNVRDVHLTLPEIDGLRVLEPQIRDRVEAPGDRVGGERVTEWLLIPQRPGTFQIPPLQLESFDPATGKYRMLSSQQLVLTATGSAVLAGESVNARDERVTSDDTPRFPPLRTRAELSRSKPSIVHERWYPWLLALPPFAYLAALMLGFAQRRYRATNEAQASRHAVRAARKRLARAEELASEGNAGAFYGEIARAITAVLSVGLGEPVSGFTHEQLRRVLLDRAMAPELVTRIVDELEGCDFARFSAAGASPSEMRHCLERTNAIFERIDQQRLPAKEVLS